MLIIFLVSFLKFFSMSLVIVHVPKLCGRLFLLMQKGLVYFSILVLLHGQVTIIFVVSVGLSVCLLVLSFSLPSFRL